MLIPSPMVIQYRKTVTAKTRQLNMNSAATAPMCSRINTMEVIQLSFWRLGKTIGSVLTVLPVLLVQF
jgi:hypothetical protein